MARFKSDMVAIRITVVSTFVGTVTTGFVTGGVGSGAGSSFSPQEEKTVASAIAVNGIASFTALRQFANLFLINEIKGLLVAPEYVTN
jgi:hypothetical protein